MKTVLALVVFLVLFHPRRRRPGVRHDAVFLIRLILLDRPDVLHQMEKVVVAVLNLRILRFGKSLFIAIQRKRTQLHIAVLFRQRILAFDREIRCTDLRAAHGEIRTLFAIQFLQHRLAFLYRQTCQHESRTLRQRTAKTVNRLSRLGGVDHNGILRRAFLEHHRLFLGTFIPGLGSQPNLR